MNEGFVPPEFWKGHLYFLHLPLYQGYFVRHAVDYDNFLRLLNDGRHIDADDMFCSGLHGKPVCFV